MAAQKYHGLTEGSIPKQMLLFALPMFISSLFQQLYNAVDSLIVGNILGDQELASVASGGSLIFLMTGFVFGISAGAGVVIARYFGAQDKERLHKAVHTTVAIGIVCGIFLTAFGFFFTPWLLELMATPDDVMPHSVLYFRIYSLGCITVVLYNFGACILQSIGDSRSPMIFLIVSAVSNVILDLVFIWGLGGGVSSAALATVLSQGLSAFLVFSKLIRLGRQGHEYGVSIRSIRIDFPMLKNVITQGIPSGIQNSVTSISHIVVQGNINLFGAMAMAGCGTHMKIEGFAFLSIMCFSMALATFVSQNLGANKPERVMGGIKFGLTCSIISAQIVGVILFFGAPFFIGLFSANPEVIYYGSSQLKIAALFAFVLAIDHCSIGILRGFGRPIIAMGIVLAIWCLFRIVFITGMLHFIHDIFVIFWTFPLTWSMTAVLFVYFLYRETRRLQRNAIPDGMV
ncbi:MAG: MATE family efflux transporter [Oxalobacter sp.]|nr:MATE family efflux transporter [Oxalobacter sp.]